MEELVAGPDDECRELWTNLTLGYTEYGGFPLLRSEVAARYRTLGPDDVNVLVPLEGILPVDARRCSRLVTMSSACFRLPGALRSGHRYRVHGRSVDAAGNGSMGFRS